MLQEGCVDHLDLTECARAFEFCEELTGAYIEANKINQFDVRRVCFQATLLSKHDHLSHSPLLVEMRWKYCYMLC